MKNNKLITLFLALLVCFSLVVTVSAASELTIAVEASASTVEYNKTIKVSVMINENPGNLGVNFDVKWGSELELVSYDSSKTAFSAATIVRKDNRIIVTIGDPSLGVQYPHLATKIEGTGKVIDLTFKVKEGADVDATTSVYLDRLSYCDLNGKGFDLNDIHEYINVVSTNHKHTPGDAATCTTGQVCTHCFAELVPALGHKPGANATCTTNQTCKVCNLELVPALGHTEAIDAAVSATCTATGLTEGKHCSVCNEVLVKQNVVEKVAHTPEVIPAVAPTCTATGLKAGEKCSACGEILKKQEVAEKIAHTSVTVPSVSATCTKTGLTSGAKCSVCNEVLKAQETVAALGHNWGSSWVNSSSSGHWKACKSCGEKKEFAAHTMSEGVCAVCGYGCKHTGGTATCSEQAVCTSCNKPYGELLPHTPGAAATCSTAQICTVCNAVITEKLDHELEFIDAKAATCGAVGWEKYEKCKNCDYSTYKEIVATGNHTFGDWTVVKEATTKEAGEESHTCTVCNFAETREIAPVEIAIPWLWIIVLIVLVCVLIVVFITIKKKKK